MAGTQAGGLKTRDTVVEKYGADFYKKIGAKGGSKTAKEGCDPKGFAANPELARRVGALGGRKSKRGKSWKV